MDPKKIKAPLDLKTIKDLKSGDIVNLSGVIFSARDEAHKRIINMLKRNEPVPVKLKDQVVFYLGPSPAPPGKVSGGIGPTTSARMDGLTEPLLREGVKALIGKGRRSDGIRSLLKKYRAIYFIAPGGVAAYLSKKVKKIEPVAYQDLGPEAVFKLLVEDLPLIVAYDIYGGDIFKRDEKVPV